MRGILAIFAASAALRGFSGEKAPAGIEAWVRQLGSESFESREEAQKGLLAWCLEDPEPRMSRLPRETGDAESDARLSRIRKAVQSRIDRRRWQDPDGRVPCARLLSIREDGLLICQTDQAWKAPSAPLTESFLVLREGKPIAQGQAVECRGSLLMLQISEVFEGEAVRCGDRIARIVKPRAEPETKERK